MLPKSRDVAAQAGLAWPVTAGTAPVTMPGMDYLAAVLLRHLEGLGLTVEVLHEDEQPTFIAIDPHTGHGYVVRAPPGLDYLAAVELARLAGVVLEDG